MVNVFWNKTKTYAQRHIHRTSYKIQRNRITLTSTKIEIQNILPDTNFICFVIPALFSKLECNELLDSNTKNSFQKAISNYPTYYRNNDRFVIDNDILATTLFDKVSSYLPKTIKISSNIQSEKGTWHLKELNHRLRFCKYSANQYFHRHLDGVHYRNETTQSKLTFMIYLNSATEFKGGRTLFYKTKETDEIWASYIPKQGDLIVFDHNVWHEGEILTEGEKFVLRSDILYTKKLDRISKKPFIGHLGYIWSLLKLNGTEILSGGRDKEIKVWTLEGKQKYSLKGHENSVLHIEKISSNIFISASRDKQIIVWADYKAINKIKIHSAVVLSICKLSETTFASSSGDNTIKISNIDGQLLRTFTEHSNWVWKVIKLGDKLIATSSEDNSIKIWSTENEKSICTVFEDCSIITIAFNESTKQLISGNLSGNITVRTLTNDLQLVEKLSFKAHNGIIRTIKFINENQFATGGEDNKIKIWSLSGQLITELEHQNFVQSIELLDDQTLISASYDGTIKTWTV